jgi:hypothetical protein
MVRLALLDTDPMMPELLMPSLGFDQISQLPTASLPFG